MPITKQAYLQKLSTQPTLPTALVRTMGRFTQISDYLRSIDDENNKELFELVSKIQEGLLFLAFPANASIVSDESFNAYMEAFDKIPSVMNTKIKPEGKTVRDYLEGGKSLEENVQMNSEFRELYNGFELTASKDFEGIAAEGEKAKEQILAEAEARSTGNPLDAIPVFPENEKTGAKKTAAKWIEGIRDVHSNYNVFTETDCASIMAARLLADSDRGHADKLEATELRKSELEFTAKWLKENCDFGSFFASNRKKIFKAARSGHGGGIDDLFKSYIKKLPAGTMPTRGLYARYMPTARERIAELKKQIEAGKNTVTAAAEIVALRNLVKAEQGQKSTLDRKLNPEQMQKLHDQVQLLSQDPTFKKMITEDPTAAALLTKGHGGDFLAHLRNTEKNHPDMNQDAVSVLNGSTLGTHMEELRKKASDMQRELEEERERLKDVPGDERDMTKTWKIIDQSKELLAEYLACDNLSRKPIKGQVDKEQRLLQDVPAAKISEQVRKRDQNPVFSNLVNGMSMNKTISILNAMASKQQDEFMRDLADGNLVKEKAKAPAVNPVVNDNGPEAEHQNILNP